MLLDATNDADFDSDVHAASDSSLLYYYTFLGNSSNLYVLKIVSV